jgi:multiple antibiotic resistance protein
VNTEIIKIILAFLVLINPFGALTLFLDSTRGYSMNNRRKVARVACLTIFITISFFTIVGETLLKALGISIGSFQLAGGILVFLIALNKKISMLTICTVHRQRWLQQSCL